MTPTCLVLDLDNTMYPKSSGLDEAMRLRIISYLVERCGLSEPEAVEARERYLRKYGLSLPGILDEFDMDIDDYQEYIHNVGIGDYVKPNPGLDRLLRETPMRKAIYTNSSQRHVESVLTALRIDSALFSHVVDYKATGCLAKPLTKSFDAMLGIIGATGRECVMVDDMPRTISVAKAEFGMRGVLVDEAGGAVCDEADWRISNINELGAVLKSLLGS